MRQRPLWPGQPVRKVMTAMSAPCASARRGAPWLEKYRPRTLEDVVHQTEAIKMLQQTLVDGSMPHLLFHGPPGVGKTTTILAVVRQMYGADFLRSNVLELNASMDRGIDVIREKVKRFASYTPAHTQPPTARSQPTSRTPSAPQSLPTFSEPRYGDKPVTDEKEKGGNGRDLGRGGGRAPFKVVVLDEADSMTREAQGALRRVMEVYVGSTRFCIICNYITKIIDPIISRTVHFRFQPIPVDATVGRLQHIATSERLTVEPQALKLIATLAEGDMRRAISTLHSAHHARGGLTATSSAKVTVADVEAVSAVVPQEFVRDIVRALANRNDFNALRRAAKECVWSAYPVLKLLESLSERFSTHARGADSKDAQMDADAKEPDVKEPEEGASPGQRPQPINCLSDEQRALVAIEIACTEDKLRAGADEEVQLTALFTQIADIISHATHYPHHT